jgi:adenine-specific DNA-methyltransferase
VKSTVSEKRQREMQDAVATAEVLFSLGQSEAQAIGAGYSATDRRRFAEGLTAAALKILWKKRTDAYNCRCELRASTSAPETRYSGLAERLGSAMDTLSETRAGYLVGRLYTALLPDAVRKTLGAFYTPPPLADRLLELAEASGFDWRRGRIVDPACGGAAFLVPVALKLATRPMAR